MHLFCKKEDLKNESDVEQKLIQPLLTSPEPVGLGYGSSDYRTKPNLRGLTIGKGSDSKIYYPDYAIIIQGLPLLIIEVKHPEVALDDAFREARLYAGELNASFPTNVNPCHKIIISNGKEVIAAFSDSNDVQIKISYDDLFVGSDSYAQFVDFASKKSLHDFCEVKFKSIRSKVKFSKPLRLLGGKSIQDQELEQNSFGADIALDYKKIFNPDTAQDRKNIVKHAYVASKKKTKHVEPIERIIKKFQPLDGTSFNNIEDTENPIEIVSKLQDISNRQGDILLLVGAVGSGKSTFIDYLTEVGLGEDLKNRTVWLSIDLNKAPISRDRIYNWIAEELIRLFNESFLDIDFEELDTLNKLYSPELSKVKKGPAALFEENSLEYNKLISAEISKLINDPVMTVKAFIRYMCAMRGKTAVIVLDNCDKRSRDDQLFMFDVAKWAQNEFKSLIVLPLRHTTYDHHRLEPPLDTVIKDLVFRIDPPLLMEVISKRVKYAVQCIKTKDNKNEKLFYYLSNGMKVKYSREEQKEYLAGIMRSLFQTDIFLREMITGVAGRDIRKGLEIFLDFCKSGHISTDEILKLKEFGTDYRLPRHVITKVLFRGNRRFYRDENSKIKNLFKSFPEDNIPDPFLRLDILQWLKVRYRVLGPAGINGFHKVSELISDMISVGHTSERTKSEVMELIKVGCINSESQNLDNFNENDLIALSSSGHVHLKLVENVDYLAACSEDVWYRERATAASIKQTMIDQDNNKGLSLSATLKNAKKLIDYLQLYRENFISKPEVYLSEKYCENLFDFSQCMDVIQKRMRK